MFQVIIREKKNKKIKKGLIKMSKYQVEIVETLSRVVDIEANNYEEALEKAQKKYDDSDIILDWEDLENVDYKKYPYPKLKEDIMLEINYDKINNSVIIGTENSSGVEYHCSDIEDLKNSINEYIDDYIDYTYENEKDTKKDSMELG